MRRFAALVLVLGGCRSPGAGPSVTAQPATDRADSSVVAVRVEARAPAVRCHLWRKTESDPVIRAWDVEEPRCTADSQHLIERSDSLGRVVELVFVDRRVNAYSSAWNAPIIRFAYEGDRIIETQYHEDGTPFGVEGVPAPYRTEYLLQDSAIVDCWQYIGLSESGRPHVEDQVHPEDCPYITGYLYSRSRYGGLNPTAVGADTVSVYRSGG